MEKKESNGDTERLIDCPERVFSTAVCYCLSKSMVDMYVESSPIHCGPTRRLLHEALLDSANNLGGKHIRSTAVLRKNKSIFLSHG